MAKKSTANPNKKNKAAKKGPVVKAEPPVGWPRRLGQEVVALLLGGLALFILLALASYSLADPQGFVQVWSASKVGNWNTVARTPSSCLPARLWKRWQHCSGRLRPCLRPQRAVRGRAHAPRPTSPDAASRRWRSSPWRAVGQEGQTAFCQTPCASCIGWPGPRSACPAPPPGRRRPCTRQWRQLGDWDRRQPT